MKMSLKELRWSLPALVALSSSAVALTSAIQAQQPLSRVELAEPVPAAVEPQPLPQDAAAEPMSEANVTDQDGEPTPADPPARETAPPKTATTYTVSDDATEAETAPIAEDGVIVELVKERYPSGAIKIEREMTQDAEGNYLLHGLWRQFDEQGRLMTEGRYVRGKREGLWRRFYVGGETPLLDSSPYKEFEAPFVSQATFRSGALSGSWTLADAKQRKVHDIEFADGERNGKATWYFPTGVALLEANYVRGRVQGNVVKYGADASIVAEEHFEEGRRQGHKVEFHDEAKQVKKAEMGYLHAPLVISKPDDFESGALATFETRGEDERHGDFRAWHENGQLAKQGEFRYGLPVGAVIHWYANGQKQMEGQYIDGRQHGTWVWWHENGQKAVTGEYHDGVAASQWSWWHATGKLAQRADLSEGRPVLTTPTPPPDIQTAERPSLEPILPRR
jgi:antitoxin component YwqK of YwqJK toxin-antitoxin module